MGLRILDDSLMRDELIPQLRSEAQAAAPEDQVEIARVMRELCVSTYVLPTLLPPGSFPVPAIVGMPNNVDGALALTKDFVKQEFALPAFVAQNVALAEFAVLVFSLALQSRSRGPLFLCGNLSDPLAPRLGYASSHDNPRLQRLTWDEAVDQKLASLEWRRARVLQLLPPLAL